MARKGRFDYFGTFQKQARIACDEADMLIDIVENFTTAEAVRLRMPEAHELEHQGDMINHSIYNAVATDFITPIDRDDILNMAQSLDEIIDEIEDVIQLFYMMDVHFMHDDAREMALIISKSTESLCAAMGEFADFRKSERFKSAIVDVNSFEEEADELFTKIIHDLHTVDRDNPMRVLVWSRIFTKMEKCTDACEHVADMMGTILLKNA